MGTVMSAGLPSTFPAADLELDLPGQDIIKTLLKILRGMQVHMLADSHGNLARALGIELDMSEMLGTKRIKR